MSSTTYQAIGDIMRSATVRKKLDEVAGRLKVRLDAITAQNGGPKVAGTVTLSSGTRPKGRAYAQVGLTAVRRLDAQGELAQLQGGSGAAVTARLRATARSPKV